MAKIILQGTKEEVKKIEKVMKETLSICDKKSSVEIDEEHISIIDAYVFQSDGEVVPDEKIEKAAKLCGNAEVNCHECPYFKEPDCNKVFNMDYAGYVKRLFARQCSGEIVHGEN